MVVDQHGAPLAGVPVTVASRGATQVILRGSVLGTLVGALPGWNNAFTACGFSGHGMQQAPAIGRGVAEWIAHGGWRTLDLSPLGWQRVLAGRPLRELNVI